MGSGVGLVVDVVVDVVVAGESLSVFSVLYFFLAASISAWGALLDFSCLYSAFAAATSAIC